MATTSVSTKASRGKLLNYADRSPASLKVASEKGLDCVCGEKLTYIFLGETLQSAWTPSAEDLSPPAAVEQDTQSACTLQL